mmetsp:Transcript_22650/g.45866  ORF Transcript_22650/g.45866 Transcript_22650/m.45866 type:complete len:565 (-) Transcript_22650:124-1818(-)
MVLKLHTIEGRIWDRDRRDKIEADALIDLLEHNDPGLVALEVSYAHIDPGGERLSTAEDSEAIGNAIAKSSNLKKLRLVVCSLEFTNLALCMLEKVNENRSLHSLEMCFFQEELMNNIKVLESFLKENKKLKSVQFVCCRTLHLSICDVVTPLTKRDNPLEELSIECGRFGDKGIKEMTTIFRSCPHKFPRKFYYKRDSFSDEGCYCLSEIFSHEDVKLEVLSLSCNRFITHSGFRAIATALAGKNEPLQVFGFRDCGGNNVDESDYLLEISKTFLSCPNMLPNEINSADNLVSREGLLLLGELIIRREFPLDALRLSRSLNAPAEGILSLLSLFRENPDKTPRVLDLKSCEMDNNHGIEIAKLLKMPNCSLEALDISGNYNLDSGIMWDIMSSLDRNTKLREISWWMLDEFYTTKILCNSATIAATYSSNHTLVRLTHSYCLPLESLRYLKMNNHPDKAVVGRIKVVEHHFVRNFDLRHFTHMGPSLLAQVISVVDRAFVSREEKGFSTKTAAIANNRSEYGGNNGGIDTSALENNSLSIIFMILRNIPSFYDYQNKLKNPAT